MNRFTKYAFCYYKFLWIILYLQQLTCQVDGQADPCEVGGSRGECVPLPACAQYVALLREPATLLQGLKVTQETQCGFEGNNAKVCCPQTVSLNVLSKQNDDDDHYVASFPEPPDCGNGPGN